MADLRDELIARIAATGPLTLAEFISDCLLHPKYGYYTTRAPFGREGDFTTAPEMSQMFGELLGLWLAQIWHDQGATSTFALVEMGPGRGTLMADLLRATRSISGFHDALDLHLIEASPGLRDRQSKQLGVFSPTWHQTLNTVPDLPLFLVANEFFDALPVRQFIRDGGQWRERCVMIREGTLAFGLTDAAPQAALAYRLTDTKQGDLVETCITSQAIAQQIGQRIKARG
ncbi:MAG: SAM-dependent methyltransferase, partial [Paracoccaceae bacterium]|nr:SAM-dependent methyltransferase [Paracoccaceae bacterium]